MIKRRYEGTGQVITGWEFKEIETGYEIFENGCSRFKILDLDIEDRGHIGIESVILTIIDRNSGNVNLIDASDKGLEFFNGKVPSNIHDEIAAKLIIKKMVLNK